MDDRLLIGTRKGLFILQRQLTGWSMSTTAFLGQPVTAVLSVPHTTTLYCALNLGHFGPKLHRSDDSGQTWWECSTPAYSSPSDEEEKPAKLIQIWCLESAGASNPESIWAGTIPGGLFRSADRGESWELLRSLWDRPERKQWFGGGYDNPGIHSVCVDARDNRCLTVAVSSGGVWVTQDGGARWACRSTGLRAAYMPPERAFDPAIQDPHRVVQCRFAPDNLWLQHHNGIFRSTNGAELWTEITDVRPSVFGFAVAVHPNEPDTAWFVPAVKDECRVPVDGKLVVTRTRDGGQNFTTLHSGLPQSSAYDLVYRHGLDVDSNGRCLALGSTTGNLWVSENQGDAWQSISTHLPPIYCVRFI